jgi:hypothetical protein
LRLALTADVAIFNPYNKLDDNIVRRYSSYVRIKSYASSTWPVVLKPASSYAYKLTAFVVKAIKDSVKLLSNAPESNDLHSLSVEAHDEV